MDIGEYIQGKIDKYNKDYRNPQSQISYLLSDRIVKQEKWRYEQVLSNRNQIKNNNDLQSYLNAVTHKVDFYNNFVNQDKPLVPLDSFDVYLSIYSLLCALQKVAKHYNSDYCNFHYTLQDIDNIFNELIASTKKFDETTFRNACRD